MAKRKQPFKRVKAEQASGRVARSSGQTLTTHAVGALPILNHILERMRLEEFLEGYLPREDGRTKLRTSRVLMLMVRNMLVARDPIYGVGEWAAGYAPDLLGISAAELDYLNDDRGGRSLDKLAEIDISSLVLAVASHVVKRFAVELSQMHNDSTTVSFFGAYDQQGQETPDPDPPGLAITWGHNKDHRPDLKQLLYILTVSRDGATPIPFSAASGNVGRYHPPRYLGAVVSSCWPSRFPLRGGLQVGHQREYEPPASKRGPLHYRVAPDKERGQDVPRAAC